jgi:hypothetical protein
MPLPDISLKRINCVCHVHTPMFEYNNKKYIRLTIPDGTTFNVRSAQSRVFPKNPNVDNPLDGNVLTVKVPFRYRRVMCSYEGAPIQSLKKSDKVEMTTDFTGAWNVGNHSGYTWKLSNIKLLDTIIV